MSDTGKRQSMVQLRRLLRRLDRSHSGDQDVCQTCSLQRLAAQLVDELEREAHQVGSPDLGPGAASVMMAVEALIAVMWALDVQSPEEQGRVLQALLDHVGNLVLDQLAIEEEEMEGLPSEGDDAPPAPPGPRQGGLLH